MIKIRNLTTVDGIVKQFNDMIEQLDAVSNSHRQKIETNNTKIEELASDNSTREAEVKRAMSVRNKIEQLIKE